MGAAQSSKACQGSRSCRSSLAAEVTPPCGLAVTWCHLVARGSEHHASLSLRGGHLSKGSITLRAVHPGLPGASQDRGCTVGW